MERRLVLAMVAILLVFAIGLVGFFMFSNGLPDGLDKTLEENGVEESEPAYHAPLDYGGDFKTTLLMGGIGFALTLLAVLAVLKLRKAARSP